MPVIFRRQRFGVVSPECHSSRAGLPAQAARATECRRERAFALAKITNQPAHAYAAPRGQHAKTKHE